MSGAPLGEIPLADLGPQHAETAEEALAAIAEVARGGRFILGEPVARFERQLAAMCGAEHAVGVASGTDALVLALRACGVGEGDAVATTPLTFAASAEAIVRVGARPLFCDVDGDTLNLSADAVRARVDALSAEDRARVRAVVPVHLFGRACDMRALMALAAERGWRVVEDAAQAIGARAADAAGASRAVGAIGDAGCFSFFPSKNLGAWGDGGAVVTRDAELAARVRRLRAHGAEAGGAHGEPRFVEVGYNSRLDAVHAAVLEVKARRLDAWTRARVEAAERYRALLAPLADVARAPSHGAPGAHVFHQYVLRVARRAELAAHLAAAGIASRAYYATPLHRQPAFALRALDAETAPLANAERAAGDALAIPIFYGITLAQQERVVRAIASFEARGKGEG